ncbi:hypothetical protein O1611_g1946 [Lasiodiplodia mahajangana]|uniref:Uncharacterized protein n=1 Tax=Lasiodiplodia mahajangana TaxID=1108764 RepID=A0ACC2JW91_9PEZI|nr:hypothetical protein O1611_g1946 [Lasiodiplodia mahajangana]
MNPRIETEVTLLTSPRVDANCKDDKANNGDDLDGHEVGFELSKPANGQKVTGREGDPEYGNEDTDA